MRKSSAALATLSLAAAALTGCAAAPAFDGASCDRDALSTGVDSIATISGEIGTAPDVELHTPIGDVSGFDDVIVGEGRAITSATQKALVEFSVYSGETGDFIGATAYDEQVSQMVSVADYAQSGPALAAALECATEGTRSVVVFSADEAAMAFGVDEPAVVVLDVVSVFPSRAEGTAQFNDGRGLPSVVRAPDGRPGIIVPDTEAPTELVAQTLIAGDGETVAEGDSLLVQYTGVTWADKKVFDSSWERGATIFDLQQLIPGFSQGLIGQTVGSQVLIVVPPELGYGEQGTGSIPGGSTLVFVVDILAIESSAAAG
ncbi:FKBP-type peptidyl-prolyl cis-trans isomerase [uncultured Microbacterium sp.]|uniref:FKBP-type peptidyl-prolyl cis-trans isomerase n=1 Tax=uncultured Microbacterium sp. TaxID=191216 RepID=UPI00261241E1|nr:FKBP-type peptidyl-prolyl cis-trans isomerase [uncultured Microbacterium sp.]